MKYKIEYKKKIPYGYIGMNKYAAKPHHIVWNHKKHPEHTIEIKKGLPHSVKVATIRHEEIEEYLMKNKHMGYHKAHSNALRFENYNKPFPNTRIKEKLKKMGFRIKK